MKRQIPLDEEKSTQRQQEYEFIRDFIQDSFFDGKHAGEQLRALWTAYCYHAELDADSDKYYKDLLRLWRTVCDRKKSITADWADYNTFILFMSGDQKITRSQREYKFIRDFVRESSFDEDLARNQLRSLWTSYCFHADLNVDTARYDADLQELWEIISDGGKGDTADWSSFVSFDNFMAELLV